jgi:hypothetical protein
MHPEGNVDLVRFLALFLGVLLLAGCGGTSAGRPPSAPVTSRGDLVGAVPPCEGNNLRVGRPSWVSPISQVNLSGVRVTNVGSRSCTLFGWPQVIAVAKGLPSVLAVRGAYGLTPPNEPPVKLTLHRSGWVSVLFAVSHSCEPMPTHIYNRLVMTIRGRRFAVALPARTRSANRSFRAFDLRMAASPSCPPALSPYLSGVHLPG